MENINELRKNMIESLESFKIEVTKSMMLALDECKNQEQLDNFFDDYFKQKWLSCDDYNYDLVEEHDKYVYEYYIGNGMYGFEYEDKRFMTLEHAIEYVEENVEDIEDCTYVGDKQI